MYSRPVTIRKERKVTGIIVYKSLQCQKEKEVEQQRKGGRLRG